MADTVLVTGISGFIAKHLALRLLQAGYQVRGTLRRLDRAAEVRAALSPHLPPEALDRLAFAEADLEADAGWDAAMQGVAALMHTASPFVIEMPRDEQVLIRPAVQGTRRALTAAARAGVKRVVLTSSIVAIETPGRREALDEGNWLDMTSPTADPYGKSKALAEREAWAIAAREGLDLTTVNPGWVLGPPLDTNYGTSIELIARVLRGRDPMLPEVGFALVDVRDVVEMHLRALERPETAGKRFLAVGGKMTLVQMGQALKAAYPQRRIATRAAPMPLLRLLALFDKQTRAALPRVGWMPGATGARAEAELGMRFIPARESLLASADFLVRSGKV